MSYEVGSNSSKAVIVRPLIAGSLGAAYSRVRNGDVKIDALGKTDLDYSLLHGLVLAASSMVAEAISQYALPEISAENRMATKSGSALISSLSMGAASSGLHYFLAPKLANDIPPWEMFVEGVVVDASSQYLYENFVSPMLTSWQ